MTFLPRCLLLCLAALFTVPADAATLNEVRGRGSLNCGVSQGLAGFSSVDGNGNWTGCWLKKWSELDLFPVVSPTLINSRPIRDQAEPACRHSGQQ